jgi:hypothetical protein
MNPTAPGPHLHPSPSIHTQLQPGQPLVTLPASLLLLRRPLPLLLLLLLPLLVQLRHQQLLVYQRAMGPLLPPP